MLEYLAPNKLGSGPSATLRHSYRVKRYSYYAAELPPEWLMLQTQAVLCRYQCQLLPSTAHPSMPYWQMAVASASPTYKDIFSVMKGLVILFP
jgi:hypothetical protein